MKTVMFAWELGRGLGHLMNMRRIAQRLAPHGVRTMAAVDDPSSAGPLRNAVDEIVGAPRWPLHSRPAAQRFALSSATLNDILSGAGLADGAAVDRLLGAWDEHFRTARPDLVIADFAPLAAMAARGRVPLVLIGNGYTLPPQEMPRFPLLHRQAPPMWDEERTLATVNSAVCRRGWTMLERLPQLFSGDACLVQSFPLLDPYDTQRIQELDGPIFDRMPEPRTDANSVFVYLSAGYVPHPSIFGALKPFARRLRIHAPGAPVDKLGDLRRAGARIDFEPMPLADMTPAARLLVHNGGSGVASEALVAGVPQLVLSAQIEQDLNGEALRSAGVGNLIKIYEPGASVSSELIAGMLADEALAVKAAEVAEQHRRYLATWDALSICETKCLHLLAMS